MEGFCFVSALPSSSPSSTELSLWGRPFIWPGSQPCSCPSGYFFREWKAPFWLLPCFQSDGFRHSSKTILVILEELDERGKEFTQKRCSVDLETYTSPIHLLEIYERPIDMIRAYRNTQADKNRETLPRRSDSLTFSFLLSKTPPTRQIRKPSLPTI